MKKTYKSLDFSAISTYSLKSRDNKVNIADHFGKEITAGLSLLDFTSRLPHLLGAKNLHEVAELIVAACHKKKPVILAIGGHDRNLQSDYERQTGHWALLLKKLSGESLRERFFHWERNSQRLVKAGGRSPHCPQYLG